MAPMRMGAIIFAFMTGAVTSAAVPRLVSMLSMPPVQNEAQATLLTGIITAVIATMATTIAVWGVISQRAITRRQVTFEQLARSEADGSFQIALRTFNEQARKDSGLAEWAAREKEGSEEQKAIVTILNDFELYSIGIQRGIVDGALYKQLSRGQVLSAWKNAEPFIMTLRKRVGNDRLYYEFEAMARWMREDRLPKRVFWWTGLV